MSDASKPADGGPAFPTPYYVELDQTRDKSGEISCDGGLSIRDYFAAKAMEAFIISTKYDTDHLAKEAGQTSQDLIAIAGYAVADAMLAARERKEDSK